MRGATGAATAAGLLLVLMLGFGCVVTRPPDTDAAPAAYGPEVVARAERYLATLPDLPPDWRFDRFEVEPGVPLEVGFLPARGARRGTAVVVPGFTAPLELHADEYVRLAEGGWDVAALSQRGQGRSPRLTPDPDLGHVEDYARLAADLRAFAAAQEGPVVAMAISMGGHTALRAAAEGAPFAAVAVVVPMVAILTADVPEWQARLLSGTMDRLGLGARYAPGGGPWSPEPFVTDAPPEGSICTADPARAHLRDALFLRHPELRVAAPSVGWVAATLRSQAWLRGRGPELTPPVLMVTAGRDGLVDTAAAQALCDAAPACEELHLPEAMHCVLEGVDPEADRAMDAILTFFEAAVR
jgi:lysophospholipase